MVGGCQLLYMKSSAASNMPMNIKKAETLRVTGSLSSFICLGDTVSQILLLFVVFRPYLTKLRVYSWQSLGDPMGTLEYCSDFISLFKFSHNISSWSGSQSWGDGDYSSPSREHGFLSQCLSQISLLLHKSSWRFVSLPVHYYAHVPIWEYRLSLACTSGVIGGLFLQLLWNVKHISVGILQNKSSSSKPQYCALFVNLGHVASKFVTLPSKQQLI